MKYNDLIKKHGIKPGEPGTKKIQTMINEMEGLERDLVTAKQQMADGSLSEAKRKRLEKDVKTAEAALPEMDGALCEAIELWLPRRVEFANKAKNLQKGKGEKNAASPAGGTDTSGAGAAPSQANTASAGSAGNKAKTQASNSNEPDNNPAAPGDDKKKRSGWGWLLAAAAVLAMAVVGVNVANRAK